MQTYSYAGLRAKRVLIKGDVGSGKTRLTRALLVEALRSGEEEVTLIDMAPSRWTGRRSGAGGKISIPSDITAKVKQFSPNGIMRPRLDGGNREEVLCLAAANAKLLTPYIEAFCESPTATLFVNDLTIFLHAGNLMLLQKAIMITTTFIGNAYSGSRIGDDKGSGVNSHEAEMLHQLEKSMDTTISL